MQALSERHRAFVRVVLDRPTAKGEQLSRLAGYQNSVGGHRVTAHRLLHDPRILAAIQEETEKRVRFGGLIGIAGLIKLASNPRHKEHRRACETLADRAGFGVKTEHTVHVNHSDRTGAAMVERIKLLAQGLGVDPAQLLGLNAAPKLIEGEVVDAGPAQE